jgi:hypothetical protein
MRPSTAWNSLKGRCASSAAPASSARTTLAKIRHNLSHDLPKLTDLTIEVGKWQRCYSDEKQPMSVWNKYEAVSKPEFLTENKPHAQYYKRHGV